MENNISYCKFDCRQCSVYIATASDNIEEKKKVAEKYNINLSEVNCLGCKSNKINQMCKECDIRKENKNGTSN